MTNQTQEPSTQYINQQHNTKNSALSTSAPSVINPVTQSKDQDQRLNDESSHTYASRSEGGCRPPSAAGNAATTHLTSVDLAAGGFRATEPAARSDRAGSGWSW